MGLCKTPLGCINKQTIYIQKNVQEWNNLLKNGYLTINNVCTALWVTLWTSIKYVLLVKTPSNIESSNMTVYLSKKRIYHTGSVKYLPLFFWHGHPKYQGLVLSIIGLE